MPQQFLTDWCCGRSAAIDIDSYTSVVAKTDTVFHGRSWQATAFGQPRDVLRVVEITWPAPSEGQVLVKVRACGVGLADLLITTGDYPLLPEPPVAPGQEVVGDVVAVPQGSAFRIGDRVMGSTAFLDGWGGYSDYTYVNETRAQRAPAALTDESAAGFMIGFRTAYAGLCQRVTITSGEVLLVLGAAGNTGASAVQLGKALGATVIAAAGNDEKLDFCLSLGADYAVNYRTSNLVAEVQQITGNRGADVIFDPVGGELGTAAATAIARLGRIAVIGYASGSWLVLDPQDMVLRNYTAAGVFAGGTAAEDTAAYTHLVELADRGVIRTPVSTVACFDDVPGVLANLPTAAPGKAIIRIS